MRHYIGVVHQDGESAYGIHFPDVAGCFSAADDLNELLGHATEALSLHLEGEDAPHARTLNDIRNDPDVFEDLASGAFLMSVPHIMLEGRSERVNITMDAGLIKAIDKTAKERRLTLSSFLADLARRELTG